MRADRGAFLQGAFGMLDTELILAVSGVALSVLQLVLLLLR